ncbi:hypothetical protein [Belnapia rosea]|nr:hypothetical protein [Belnapia rosea]
MSHMAGMVLRCFGGRAEAAMVAAVAISRTDLDAAGLRRAAGGERDAAASRRMLALALVLEGQSRTEAARAAWA